MNAERVGGGGAGSRGGAHLTSIRWGQQAKLDTPDQILRTSTARPNLLI